jgi:hypothetical protein
MPALAKSSFVFGSVGHRSRSVYICSKQGGSARRPSSPAEPVHCSGSDRRALPKRLLPFWNRSRRRNSAAPTAALELCVDSTRSFLICSASACLSCQAETTPSHHLA